ncbi:ferritin-like domain-containing protein [Neobacillus niacini]|uniref:ferritin-like domain-containing protein n=1 Tax=Neobacillus niacini TaxID=86668 RepID=UPI003983BC24
MSNEVIIEELNTLLRGTYMGIRSFEHYIQRVEDTQLKTIFQSMQQDVKQNAQKLAERIQNLGGVPADSEGFSGSMHSFMHNAMLPDDTSEIIEDALKGLDHYGVQYSEELVRGDLDPKSRQLAEEVIDTSRRQIDELRHYLQ